MKKGKGDVHEGLKFGNTDLKRRVLLVNLFCQVSERATMDSQARPCLGV